MYDWISYFQYTPELDACLELTAPAHIKILMDRVYYNNIVYPIRYQVNKYLAAYNIILICLLLIA